MNPCLQISSIVTNISSVTDPFYNYTATTLPYVSQQSAYSEFGTLIYDTGYTSNGSGTYQLLTTSGLWINDSGTNGPLLRSAIWTTIPTSASTHWFPLSTWIGYSYCMTLLNEKTYYVGLAGDNGSMLRLNGQIVVKQDVSTVPQSNFKYWHIYPVTLNSGYNIFEFFGYNQYDIAGFGFEVYDNTYDEITGSTVVGDLNIIYSTIDQTGTTFHTALNDTLSQTISGYTCDLGSSYTYQSCSGQCVQISAVTINTCSATTEVIQGVISEYRNKVSPAITGIGYGYKSYNGLITNQKSLIFTTLLKVSFPEIPLSDVIPPVIEHSGVTFLTDVVFMSFEFAGWPVFPYGNITCSDDPPTPDPKLWGPKLKGGSGINVYYPVDPTYIPTFPMGFPRLTGTLGFVAVDNIDNTIVGVTNTHVITNNIYYTSDRNPTDLIENVYNHEVFGSVGSSFESESIGIVKRYQPMSTTNSVNNVDAGLISLTESCFDSLSSWEQIGLTGVTVPPVFATTQELDDLLNLDPPVFSVGRTTGVKGEYDKKLKIWATNLNLYFVIRNQSFLNQVSYFDNVFGYISSATTTPTGYVCQYPAYFGDSGSAVLAEINGQIKIIGLTFAAAMDPNYTGFPPISVYGIACRIDKISQILNISPYTGQTAYFSNLDQVEVECLPGASSEACIELSGETYCQIGMCYPSIPSSAKYIRSCNDPSFGFDVDFLTYSVNDGETYILKFWDYKSLNTDCWEVVSASTESPTVLVKNILFGPFNNCIECNTACQSFDVIIFQGLLDDATGNSDPNKNNKAYVTYYECGNTTITKEYDTAGTYPSDICVSIVNTPDPLVHYFKNNIQYTNSTFGIQTINTYVSCT